MNAAVVYWSRTGNTERVASVVRQVLEEEGVEVTFGTVEQAAGLDWFGYDLLCLGFPSYHWSPPKPVDDWLKRGLDEYRKQGRIRPGAPPLAGKHVLVFCTYTGPHTGIDEALPAVKYAGQYFAHLGLPVIAEWCIVGEFHGSPELSTEGRLGDVRGRPNQDDLARVRADTLALVRRIKGP